MGEKLDRAASARGSRRPQEPRGQHVPCVTWPSSRTRGSSLTMKDHRKLPLRDTPHETWPGFLGTPDADSCPGPRKQGASWGGGVRRPGRQVRWARPAGPCGVRGPRVRTPGLGVGAEPSRAMRGAGRRAACGVRWGPSCGLHDARAEPFQTRGPERGSAELAAPAHVGSASAGVTRDSSSTPHRPTALRSPDYENLPRLGNREGRSQPRVPPVPSNARRALKPTGPERRDLI